MDGNTALSQTPTTRRRPFALSNAGPPVGRRAALGEVAAAFKRLDGAAKGTINLGEVQRFRSILASASEELGIESEDAARVVQAVRLLDAVLDSPLDLDAPLLEAVGDVLLEPSLTEEEKENSKETANPEKPAGAVPCGPSDMQEETPSSVRGYHVRQGGHDFVLPVDRIVGAFATDVEELPTVFGRTVARFSGEICDVIRLATHFGLRTRDDDSPKTLMVVELETIHVCLAVDEVVGPVDASLAAMPSAFSEMRGMTGVAILQSGGLALVPDLANLHGISNP